MLQARIKSQAGYVLGIRAKDGDKLHFVDDEACLQVDTRGKGEWLGCGGRGG